jgi:hypothetical protein
VAGPNLSPLFDEAAFSVTDPDGNVVLFERGDRRGATGDLPARAVHCVPDGAKAMPRSTAMPRFVLSDRVQDEQGTLRACFLHTITMHHARPCSVRRSALDHISCETRDIGSLAAWADRVAGRRVPLHWGVGRHGPGNDLFSWS